MFLPAAAPNMLSISPRFLTFDTPNPTTTTATTASRQYPVPRRHLPARPSQDIKMSQAREYYYQQQRYEQQPARQNDRCREIMSINNILVPPKNQGHASSRSRNLQSAPTQVVVTSSMVVNHSGRRSGNRNAASSSSTDSSLERIPREKREPYSEQEMFYVMFVRIGQELDWNQIEKSFEKVFETRRARDGLSAVYYRIRSRWGLPPVTRCSQEWSEEGKCMIRERAKDLDPGFLETIGFFDWCRLYPADAGLW